MPTDHDYRPVKYWSLTLGITWASGAVASFLSNSDTLSGYQIPAILVGLFTPFAVSMAMIYGSKSSQLKSDFRSRLLNTRLIQTKYWVFLLLVMPITLLLATSISLLFGQSTNQFQLAPEMASSGAGLIIILIILLLAPTFEELGWRGYGVDSLKMGNSVLTATALFALLWNIWHWPLFAINGYYQNELLKTHWLFALNFIVSVIPAAFIMNWVYFKNGRSIFAIIILHIMLNLFSVLFQTEQVTKCIITILLSFLSVAIFYKDRAFFRSI